MIELWVSEVVSCQFGCFVKRKEHSTLSHSGHIPHYSNSTDQTPKIIGHINHPRHALCDGTRSHRADVR